MFMSVSKNFDNQFQTTPLNNILRRLEVKEFSIFTSSLLFFDRYVPMNNTEI